MRYYERATIEAVVLGLRDAGTIDEKAIRCIARRLATASEAAATYGAGEADGMRALSEKLVASI